MTANVDIITASKTGVLLVKTADISTKNGKSYVTVLGAGKTEEKEIITGLASGGKTEIVSGLSQGEMVQPISFTATSSSSNASQSSLFSPPSNRSSSSSRGNFS